LWKRRWEKNARKGSSTSKEKTKKKKTTVTKRPLKNCPDEQTEGTQKMKKQYSTDVLFEYALNSITL